MIASTSQRNGRLAVFVHGLGQQHLNAWGSLPEFLERSAAEQSPFSAWDYFFFGYDSKRDANFLELCQLLNTELANAARGRGFFENRYTTLALVGYSLGTIVIRQYLAACSLRTGAPTIHSVTLLNAPLSGSLLAYGAVLAPFRGLSPKIVSELRPGSTALMMLECWTRCAYEHHRWPKPRILFGAYDPVVLNVSTNSVWEGDLNSEHLPIAHDIQEQLRPENGRAFQAIRDQLNLESD